MAEQKEPCPYRIVDDAGGAFAFGLVGSSIWHFVGGARNAPKGYRFVQAIARVKARTPITAGGFAIWGAVFSICDCSIVAVRHKEDSWNAIFSGAAAGGILAIRSGFKSAARNAAIGGILLAAIEGLQSVVARMVTPYLTKLEEQRNGPIRIDTLEPPVDPSWQGRKKYNPPPIFQPQTAEGFSIDSFNGEFGKDDDNSKWSSKK